MLRINAGPSADFWARYHQLSARRVAETLTPDEYVELIRLSDTIEVFQADRASALAELAARRGVTLGDLAESLGLGPGRCY